MKRRLLAAVCVCVVFFGAACTDRNEHARERALDYFASEVHEVDPGWANLFDYLHRRFGLEAWDANGVALHVVPEQQQRAEIAAVYRRLVDPSAAIAKARIAELPTTVDRITASALHCDRIALPDDWLTILTAATNAGGYALTHAAMAAQWTLESGCRDPAELAALQVEQLSKLTALARDRAALAAEYEAAMDLWIEAMVMLYYLDAGDRVDAEWLAALLEAQRPDGGWPRHPRNARSDPHATALALWVLSEQLQPDAPPIRWVPASGPR